MRTFIAVNSDLDIGARDEFNPVNPLAGQNFDIFFAGGAGYSAAIKPMPNLEGLFLENPAPSMSAALLSLNENFAEFALSPLSSSLSDTGFNARSYEAYENIKRDVRALRLGLSALRLGEDILSRRGGGSSLGGAIEINKGDVRKLAGAVGEYYGGFTGKYLAESLIDWNFSSDALIDAVFSDAISKVADYAGSVVSRGGTLAASLSGQGVSFLLKETLTEIYELATGKDISFGFGGEKVASIKGIGDVYTKPQSLTEWLASLFKDEGSTQLVDRNFNVIGSLNGYTISTTWGGAFDLNGNAVGFVGGGGLAASFSTGAMLGFNYAISGLGLGGVISYAPLNYYGAGSFSKALFSAPPLTYLGYTYQSKTQAWRAISGKEISTHELSYENSTKEKLQNYNFGGGFNSGQNLADYFTETANRTPGFSLWWSVSDWGEVRPVFPLHSLRGIDILDAFDVLVLFYQNVALNAEQPLMKEADAAAEEARRARNEYFSASIRQQSYLAEKIANYERVKKRGKKGKSELYPVVYL